MPRQEVKAEFDGEAYTFTYLATSQATELAAEVGLLVGPALVKMLPKEKGLSQQEAKEAFMGQDISPAFAALAMNTNPKRMAAIIKELCSVVIGPQGLLTDAQYELHFQGRPGVALQVAAKSF